MTAFEIAEQRVLIALLIEFHKGSPELLGVDELMTDYALRVENRWVRSIFADLGAKGWALVVEAKAEEPSAVLLEVGYKPVLNSVLKFLDADTFEISWKHERIVTDALQNRDIPCGVGWTLMFADKRQPAISPATITDAPVTQQNNAGGNIVGRDHITHFHNAQPQAESGWTKWASIATILAGLVALAVWLYGDGILRHAG